MYRNFQANYRWLKLLVHEKKKKRKSTRLDTNGIRLTRQRRRRVTSAWKWVESERRQLFVSKWPLKSSILIDNLWKLSKGRMYNPLSLPLVEIPLPSPNNRAETFAGERARRSYLKTLAATSFERESWEKWFRRKDRITQDRKEEAMFEATCPERWEPKPNTQLGDKLSPFYLHRVALGGGPSSTDSLAERRRTRVQREVGSSRLHLARKHPVEGVLSRGEPLLAATSDFNGGDTSPEESLVAREESQVPGRRIEPVAGGPLLPDN